MSKVIRTTFFVWFLSSAFIIIQGKSSSNHDSITTTLRRLEPYEPGSTPPINQQEARSIDRTLVQKDIYENEHFDSEDGHWHGTVVQDIRAPMDVIWNHILNFESYPEGIMASSLLDKKSSSLRILDAHIYKQTNLKSFKNKNDGTYMKKKEIHTKFQYYIMTTQPSTGLKQWTIPFFSPTSLRDAPSDNETIQTIYLKFTYVPSRNTLTWTLDEQYHHHEQQQKHVVGSSSLSSSEIIQNLVGMCHIQSPHPTKGDQWSRITFMADAVLAFGGSSNTRHPHQKQARHTSFLSAMLRPFHHLIHPSSSSNSILSDITSWIKTISEEEFTKKVAVTTSSKVSSSLEEHSSSGHILPSRFNILSVKEEGTYNESSVSSFTCQRESHGYTTCYFYDEDYQQGQQKENDVGLVRYFLVTLVFLLFLANLYLCLDRNFG